MSFGTFQNWLQPGRGRDEVALAQLREVRGQIPWLYALLCLNSIAIASSYYSTAPDLLTIWFPAVLVSACLLRMLVWAIGKRRRPDPEQARAQLWTTTLMSGIFGIGFVYWALELGGYGNELQRAYVAFYIATTVIGCIFCLMNLPQAALLLTAVVMLPTLIHFLMSGQIIFAIMALNIALVTGVMIQVLAKSHRTFVQMVKAQEDLARIHRQALQLGDENDRLAHTDSLTNLPNRRYFFGRLDRIIAEQGGQQGRFAIGLIDLDRFKPVNDTHGHLIGDQLLEKVADRLLAVAGTELLIARLGGDEFAFLAEGGANEAQAIGDRLCQALSEPFDIAGLSLSLGASCGIANYPDAGQSAQQLFDRADFALYEVKVTARGGVRQFSSEQEDRLRSERVVEAQLQSASLHDQLHVHFQPVVDLQGRRVAFVESLARWTSPLLGVVPPGQFITIAEKTGLIRPITLRLLEMALEQGAALPANIGVAFNLSAQNLRNVEMIDSIAAVVRNSGMTPSRISFELTERAVMQDQDAALNAMQRLKDLGANISLDDFGTGLSSLGQLHRLPLDRVKVDRSLTSGHRNAELRNMLGAIRALCVSLGLECVVEGVESQVQLARLRSLGYRYAQGYLFARPMAMPALLAWMESGELRSLLNAADVADSRDVA